MINANAKLTKKVFISHSSKDRTAANELVSALEIRGVACWYSHRDIPAGSDDYSEDIIVGMEASCKLVVIVSRESINSKHVRSEVAIAKGKNYPIIPVRLIDIEITGGLQFFLELGQRFDLFPSPTPELFDELTEKILGDKKNNPEIVVDNNASAKREIEYPDRVIDYDRTYFPSEVEQKLAEEYKERLSSDYMKEFTSEHIIPYPADYVWKAIKSTEYLGYWLQGNYQNGRGYSDAIRAERWPVSAAADFDDAGGTWLGVDLPLPDKCGRGTILSVSEYDPDRPSPCLFYLSEEQRLIEFRYGNYFIVSIERMPSINKCRLKINEFNFITRPAGIWDRYKFHKKFTQSKNPVSDELRLSKLGPVQLKKEHGLAVNRLNNILHDIEKFGRFIDRLDQEYQWIEYGSGKGWNDLIIRLYSEDDGKPILSPGKTIIGDQHLGYYQPVEGEFDHSERMKSNYVCIWAGEWIVQDVFKCDGDIVTAGDKIALIRKANLDNDSPE